jgi:hypothetical protein
MARPAAWHNHASVSHIWLPLLPLLLLLLLLPPAAPAALCPAVTPAAAMARPADTARRWRPVPGGDGCAACAGTKCECLAGPAWSTANKCAPASQIESPTIQRARCVPGDELVTARAAVNQCQLVTGYGGCHADTRAHLPTSTVITLTVWLPAVPLQLLFHIQGCGQVNFGITWGNGFVTDSTLISRHALSDPNPFFKTLLTKPYRNRVGGRHACLFGSSRPCCINAPHSLGPSILSVPLECLVAAEATRLRSAVLASKCKLAWINAPRVCIL